MKSRFAILLVCLVFILAACASSREQGPSPEQVFTQAAQTVQAQITQTAEAQGTSTPSPTVTPTLPATSTATPTPDVPLTTPTFTSTPTSACTLRATFVTDITIPDGTIMRPGEEFTKTWQLMNAGTCTWTNDFRVVFNTGTNMASATEQLVSTVGDVAAGTLINISIPMKAPELPGEYTGFYRLRAGNGTTFGINPDGGGSFFVKINVGGTPSPTATP